MSESVSAKCTGQVACVRAEPDAVTGFGSYRPGRWVGSMWSPESSQRLSLLGAWGLPQGLLAEIQWVDPS